MVKQLYSNLKKIFNCMVSRLIVNKLNYNSKKEESWRKKHFTCRRWRIRIVKKKKRRKWGKILKVWKERKSHQTRVLCGRKLFFRSKKRNNNFLRQTKIEETWALQDMHLGRLFFFSRKKRNDRIQRLRFA